MIQFASSQFLAALYLLLLPGANARASVEVRCEGWGCASLQTSFGRNILGNAWKESVEFLALPFAEIVDPFGPPRLLQELRRDPFDATNILADGSAACLQPGPPFTPTHGAAYGVEQCLIMNIYAPREDSSSPRPILIWVFGGGNTVDEILAFNSSLLAGRHNAVVAAANYRLGPIGFGAFEEDVVAGRSTGNSALHDLITAAKWLQREAPSFHANPEQLVFFGESSGGSLSAVLSLVPSVRGVASGSISESGGVGARSLDESLANTRAVGRAAGCAPGRGLKTCMAARLQQVVNHSRGYSWGPTVDRVLLPAMPEDLMRNGGLEGMRILWGANTNDSASPLRHSRFLNQSAYIEKLNTTINGQGDLLEEALKLYPPFPKKESNAPLVGWFQSDKFLCSTRREVLAASSTGRANRAYMYRFNWFFQSNRSCTADSNYHDPASGSNHCDEMSFVFGQPIYDSGNPPGLGYTNCSDPASKYYDKTCSGCFFNDAESKLAFDVGAFWVAFAAGHDLKGWPLARGDRVANIVFHPTSGGYPTEQDMGRYKACQFWDKVSVRHTPQVVTDETMVV